MPVVPKPDNFTVAPSIRPAGNFNNPLSDDAATFSGRQISQGGAAMMQAGHDFGQLFDRIQNEANVTRVQDVQTQLNRYINEITTNANRDGYADLQGFDAQPGAHDNRALSDVYGEKIKKKADELMGGLTNDVQRKEFGAYAAARQVQVGGLADQHMAEQFRKYRDSVNDATIATASDTILGQWQNTDIVKQQIAAIEGATDNKARTAGMAPQWGIERAREMTSVPLKRVVDTLIDQGKYGEAEAFRKLYADKMTSEDLLTLDLKMKGEVELGQAQAAVSTAAAQAIPTMAPTVRDRMHAITRAAESQGNDYDPKRGTPTESPVGARYGMQVMPATAKNPGHGIKPAQSDTPEEYNRVGSELLDKLVEKYGGDAGQAWSAYNAGERWVDEAIARATKAAPGTPQADWRWQLDNDARTPENRQQTAKYREQNLTALGAGLGGPAPVTEAEFISNAVEAAKKAAGGTASPTLIKMTTDQAKAQYQVLKTSIKDQDDQAVTTAMSAVEANGGNYYSLPASLRAQIPADKVDTVKEHADRVAKGPMVSDDAWYQKLSDDAYLRSLSDSEFNKLITQTLAPSDRQHFIDHRAELLDPTKTKNGPTMLNKEGIDKWLAIALPQMGINIHPDKNDAKSLQQLGAIRRVVNEYVLKNQALSKKQFDDADLNKSLSLLFTKQIGFYFPQFLKSGMRKESRRVMSVTFDQLPASEVSALTQQFKAQGVPNPSQGEILGAWMEAKLGLVNAVARTPAPKSPAQGTIKGGGR